MPDAKPSHWVEKTIKILGQSFIIWMQYNFMELNFGMFFSPVTYTTDDIFKTRISVLLITNTYVNYHLKL